MSDSSSDSENSQNDSEYNFISDYVFEDERLEKQASIDNSSDSEDDLNYNYDDEPLADEEWLKEYNKQFKEQEEKQEEFVRRFNGVDPVESWCKCGHCKMDYLQNPSECVCCAEVEECFASLADELVLQDLPQTPSCITLHPGFRPVCLEKWTLRTAAVKYRCRDRSRYKQKGPEACFLRSVAYREFTYLIHGYLGDNRIALPACAYNAIRGTFRDENESFTGFEEEN